VILGMLLGVKKSKMLIVEDDESQHRWLYRFLVWEVYLIGEAEK